MNRRKADLIMIDRGGLVPHDHVPCESKATATPCPFYAVSYIEFPNFNRTDALCVRCESAYFTIGYRYGSDPRNRPVTIPSQSNDHDRKLSDELTSMNEYTRRERQGY